MKRERQRGTDEERAGLDWTGYTLETKPEARLHPFAGLTSAGRQAERPAAGVGQQGWAQPKRTRWKSNLTMQAGQARARLKTTTETKQMGHRDPRQSKLARSQAHENYGRFCSQPQA